MLLEIDSHSGVPIYRQIIAQIRTQIMTGELAQDQQLDTVRDLARRLNVNPMTISKAYSFLEADQLVTRKRGIGLFVARIPQDQKDILKKDILERAVEKAAVTAVQLDVSEDQAAQLLTKFHRALNARKQEQK
ncbi:MAG TPA: GntR family transcriptional regulator [Phycisphaerales bacterium]|nr:GntR family transcriptional regulator [Phycisphaerales bacterium]